MKIIFSEAAWNEYIEWQNKDKRTLRSINKLIKDIGRNGLLGGLGRPERLKYSEMYSRRIDTKNRLLYRDGGNGAVEIISCKGHYEDS